MVLLSAQKTMTGKKPETRTKSEIILMRALFGQFIWGHIFFVGPNGLLDLDSATTKLFWPTFCLFKQIQAHDTGYNLNFIKHVTFQARYDPFFCLNVIMGITYGYGAPQYKVQGGQVTANFMLPPTGVPPYRIKIFNRRRLDVELSFGWFKRNVICSDQPWICTV